MESGIDRYIDRYRIKSDDERERGVGGRVEERAREERVVE